MIHISESISSGKSGKYSLLNGNIDYDSLMEFLESNGYDKKDPVNGNLTKDYKKADYMGQNCYFNYRDYYSSSIVVSTETDKEHVLEFSMGLRGAIPHVFLLDSTGKSVDGWDTERDHISIDRELKRFFPG